jgi:putative transposase
LGQKRPATLYSPSPRPYPESLPPIEYDGHLELRKVDDRGTIKWKNEKLFLSHTLDDETVGLKEIDDGTWSLFYGPTLLARFDERERKFYG